MKAEFEQEFLVADYDLEATLTSGQAFRWDLHGNDWCGVVGRHWVRLQRSSVGIRARVEEPVADWEWLRVYLQLDVDLQAVVNSFPRDAILKHAVTACHGLRLLKQDPWECLASFILSSTKQIVQIKQVISNLCREFGSAVRRPDGEPCTFSFPSPGQLAAASEADLRACKMGFRAPYLLETARLIHDGRVQLSAIASLPLSEARSALTELPGVGRKIADCALLFGFGFQAAFPIDVWVLRALRDLYFPHRRVTPQKLRIFADTHFGPHAGYAQQYLFHYMRTRHRMPPTVFES